jgi:hypothetical protein
MNNTKKNERYVSIKNERKKKGFYANSSLCIQIRTLYPRVECVKKMSEKDTVNAVRFFFLYIVLCERKEKSE